MSTAVAVNRPPSDVSSPSKAEYIYPVEHSRISQQCSTSKLGDEGVKVKNCGKITEVEDLEKRIEKSLRERDEQWRRHEKAQIQFLQNETSNMLKALHQEVNRLNNELREAKRKSIMGELEENEKLKIETLERAVKEKEMYIKNLEKKVTVTIQKLQEQIGVQSERIRQLNEELNDRNQTVTHLSQQLRTIRLREAMATSQHRRRASQQNSPPITSPSSPHRIFPPVSSGLLSASVAVTYPGNSRNSPSSSTSSLHTTSQRRSNSAMRAPSMPN